VLRSAGRSPVFEIGWQYRQSTQPADQVSFDSQDPELAAGGDQHIGSEYIEQADEGRAWRAALKASQVTVAAVGGGSEAAKKSEGACSSLRARNNLVFSKLRREQKKDWSVKECTTPGGGRTAQEARMRRIALQSVQPGASVPPGVV